MKRRGSVLSIFYDFDASRRIIALIFTPEPVTLRGSLALVRGSFRFKLSSGRVRGRYRATDLALPRTD